MRRNTLLLVLSGILSMFLFSCQTVEEAQAVETITRLPLLDIHEETHMKGQFQDEIHQLSFEVKEDNSFYHLTAEVEGKILEALVSYENFSIHFNGHENMLSATEMKVLNKAAIKLAERVYNSQVDNSAGHCGNDTHEDEASAITFTEAENTLVRVLDYWSNAPEGYVFGERSIVDQFEENQRRGNDGVSCIRRGRSYSLQYDGSRGNTNVTRTAGYNGGGSYGCMGRCGGNCGRWWIPSSWTLDCFEHDECSLRYGASGGSSDPNCGDEFNEAADDWTFGVIRGCRG
ncbi:MAG: hypothetical protein AAFY71_25500 [Bacteroidota bacterium]